MKNIRYSLKKLQHLTWQNYRWYLKNGNKLPEEELKVLETTFEELDKAFLAKDLEKARTLFAKLEQIVESRRSSSFWKVPFELLGALTFALIVATLIRQMVFEPYEIPSGSMRPTFREKDHLVVSKTTFGINIPLTLGHFYFDESLLPRGSVITFSGEGIDLQDTDTRYFWLFPAKKRYIKRCMAKPYDSIYFYGGLLYGVDKEGNDLTVLRDPPFNTTLDHVPFNNFEGKITRSQGKKEKGLEIVYSQFNKPIGRMIISPFGEATGQVFNGKEWVKDQPSALKSPHKEIKTYSDYYGMSNFAMARLINKEEMARLHPEVTLDPSALLYLELAHSPRLSPIGSQRKEAPLILSGQIAYDTSFIPLSSKELSSLMNNLYTARFNVNNGRAKRIEAPEMKQLDVLLSNVPNGTYEFYDGVAYEIGFMGWSTKLAKEHPIYQFTPRIAQSFFNYGMEFSTYFNPSSSYFAPFPARYAYFREGNLYVMGRLFLTSDNPLLTRFIEHENNKNSPGTLPFIDRGPPLKEGKIDVDFIRTFGYTLKENEYLALGDNYAMSSDSRTFGSVPQKNLEGTPAFILWPPQDRFGSPNLVSPPWPTLPTAVVWSIALLTALVLYLYEKKRKSPPIFKKRIAV